MSLTLLTFQIYSSIAFRDLKPQNIGLVANNIVKIFDFGLSKKLLPNSKLGYDKYHCTQNVGTPRFMAPEVFSGTIYGLSADIYSFSLVLWELLSLEVCFKNLRSVSELYSVVHKKNSRPAINKKWPRECRKLMEESWSEDPSKRLSAIEISEELQVCMRSFLLKCGRMEKK